MKLLGKSPILPARALTVLVALAGTLSGCGRTAPQSLLTSEPEPAAPAPAHAGLLHGGVAPKVDASLVDRDVFFGNPERTSVALSPDGKQIAFLAPRDGVLNVFVAPVSDPAKARAITADEKRGIRRFAWAHTNQHILFLQDQDGDENWHVYVVDTAGGEPKDLTPFEDVNAYIAGTSHRTPTSIVIAVNDRDKRLHDLHRVDLSTGARTLLQQNDEGFVGYVMDDDYKVRLGLAFTAAGGMELKVPKAKAWETFIALGPEDAMNTSPAGLDRSGQKLYLKDSRGRDKSALVELDLAGGGDKAKSGRVLFQGERADVADIMFHPKDNVVQAVATSFERKEWKALDPKVGSSLSDIARFAKGDVEIVSQSLDDRHWIVADLRDDGPVAYYHYDRAQKKERFLFVNRPDLEKVALTKMHPRVIRSRDGLDLVSYVSLPRSSDPDADGKPDRALPMVLLVHGGPWARDEWGYHPYHQWLASRGYAVLSVNFRGSTGFGKTFVNAADGEWAAKMHDDLLDAVEWAVTEKIAERDKVAIMGGSYGGYSVLVGLTFTPREFACGVDIVGPSSLVTLLENVPPYWAPFLPMLTKRVGDHKTDEGRAFLLSRSPLGRADQIERPLLIAQGKNDPRVKQQESDQIVEAMTRKNIPVVYVLYPDEGHGFARPENRTSFSAVSEIFLAQCLGGAYQPVGDDFEGSTITVPTGAEHIWGLPELLKKP